MAPHKIIAATTTEALKLVREQVGGDALVLSTRDTPEGVEIVAISPEALAKMSQRSEPKPAPVLSAPAPTPAPAATSAPSVFKSPTTSYSNSPAAPSFNSITSATLRPARLEHKFSNKLLDTRVVRLPFSYIAIRKMASK